MNLWTTLNWEELQIPSRVEAQHCDQAVGRDCPALQDIKLFKNWGLGTESTPEGSGHRKGCSGQWPQDVGVQGAFRQCCQT